MKQSDVVQNNGIAVVTYCAPERSGLSKLSFQSVEQICQQFQCPSDSKLNFDTHISNLGQKAGNQINVLA